MTARIQPYNMDPYDFIDDYGYSRLDHMDGLGMRPDMIRGPLTGLPIPAPDIEDDPVKLAIVAGIIIGVIFLAAIGIVAAAFLNGVLR